MVDNYIVWVVNKNAVNTCIKDSDVSEDYILAFLNVDAEVIESGWAF